LVYNNLTDEEVLFANLLIPCMQAAILAGGVTFWHHFSEMMMQKCNMMRKVNCQNGSLSNFDEEVEAKMRRLESNLLINLLILMLLPGKRLRKFSF